MLPSAVASHLAGPPGRAGVARRADRDCAEAHPGSESASPLVVDHDHRRPRPPVEQAGLRLEVVVHVGVEVEVILGEIGERADREVDAVGPAHGKCVTRYLHGDGPRAAFVHDGEQGLHVRASGVVKPVLTASSPISVATVPISPLGHPGGREPGAHQESSSSSCRSYR